VVDGVWSSIGSSNVDWRSFTHHDEVIAVVFGEAFGAEMNELFFRDLAAADEVREEAWRGRGAVDRLAEWLSRRLEYWL
jgi:cardiolipin synthase